MGYRFLSDESVVFDLPYKLFPVLPHQVLATLMTSMNKLIDWMAK